MTTPTTQRKPSECSMAELIDRARHDEALSRPPREPGFLHKLGMVFGITTPIGIRVAEPTSPPPDNPPHPLAAMVAEMESRGWFDLRINLTDGAPRVTVMASRNPPPEWPGPPGYPAAWSEVSRKTLCTNAGCEFAFGHLAKTLDREQEKHAPTDPEEASNC